MTSIRHKLGARPSSQEAVLAAARRLVLAVGVRRATLTDVARLAGMSRMTVYRHFPDTPALVAALMTREFGALLGQVLRRATRQRTGRAQVAFAAVSGVEALASHALFLRVLDVEPELLLPYLVDRLGTTQKTALSLFRQLVRAGQRDGSIRRGDTRLLALAVLLAAQSFLLASRVPTPGIGRTALLSELHALVDRYLAP